MYNLTAFMNGYAPEILALNDADKIRVYNSLVRELDEIEANVIMMQGMYTNESRELFVSGDAKRYIRLQVVTITNTNLYIIGVEPNRSTEIDRYLLVFGENGIEREVPFFSKSELLEVMCYAIKLLPMQTPKEPEKRVELMKTEAESEAQPVEITITEKPNKSGFSWRYKLW